MRTHPVFLRLEGRRCVVLGGDDAALGKARACLAAGGRVTVIAPELPADIARHADVEHVAREYRSGDLTGAALAYASARDPVLIERLVEDAARAGVLLNVIDVPEACAFLAPAVVERGELQIAVGTGGASPGLAARLRNELAEYVGPEYEAFVAILGGVRRALAADPARAAERGEVVSALLGSRLLELVRCGRPDEVDALLGRIAGEGCTLARLGVRLGRSA